MYQKLSIIGRVGRDPEVKVLQEDKTVANFSVATEPYPNKTQWINVTVWGRLAENVGKYVTKGSLVQCEGYLGGDENGPKAWLDKENNPRAKHEMVATSVKFLVRGEKKEELTQEDFNFNDDFSFSSTEDVIPF